MTVTLRIHGQRDEADELRAATRDGGSGGAVTDLLDAVEVVRSFNVSPAARDGAAGPQDVSVEDDDVLEIEVEGGFKAWTSAKRYYEVVPLLKPQAKVGDAVSVDTLPQVSERGVIDRVANKLRVLRMKPDRITELRDDPLRWPADLIQEARDLGIDLAVTIPAWLITKALMRIIENNLRPGPGLYTWDYAIRQAGPDGITPVSFDGFDVDQPLLVFIHGTASSTRGSFGRFLDPDAQAQWQALRRLYAGHIYAFEHRTLSDSPIDNAIDLLSALPRNARVSIVSHSRGGLVGDLVSLKSIGTDLLARFDRKDPDLRLADQRDRMQLERLATLIGERQLRIERFVRCASPSRGTLLASQNIDAFLSVLTNLIGLIPGVGGTPLFEVIKRVTLEIVKNRTKPGLVPGLEAMMPPSPLVALLNNLKDPADGAIGVIAGDIEGGNWVKRIGVFASDHIVYEGRNNDLVVNTDSMFDGARHGVAGYVFDQGADVSHFNYFKNARTRAALVDWLAAAPGQRPQPFEELPAGEFEPVKMLTSMQSRSGTDQPVVFVLPGIMGSNLRVGERDVWLRHSALLWGGLGDLGIDAPNVEPVSLVGDGYRELCEYLQTSHEVIPFAYDWRRSVDDAAVLLAREVEKVLTRTAQPVRFVAHSMGGLVVRAMIAAQPDLWDRICARAGARLVMLGTPNRGSFDIVEAVLGTAHSVQQLALLDLIHDTAQVVDIIAKFPGVLELLPDGEKYFQTATWASHHRQLSDAAVPDQDQLEAAAKTRQGLAAQLTLFPHADHVHYVAGASPRTVAGVDVVEGRVVLDATTEGDGRVTYESGRLAGVPTWYMDAVHGDLASHRPGFRAIGDLLDTGTTSRLATTPASGVRGGAVQYRTLPEPVLYPTETSLAAGLLGKEPPASYEQRRQQGFRVEVVHDDLRFAQYPVVVGHYEGDTIVGAEAVIDGRLGGALKQRYALGLYPGEFGSIAVILRKPTPLQEVLHLSTGAVVIGLGKWGDLSAADLGDVLRRAALQYVLQRCDAIDPSAGAVESAPKVGLSVLLVGGNSTSNIAVGDSVGAILRAIAQANRELADGRCDALTISDVEIIELYADRATEAAHAVKELAPLIGTELGTTIEAVQLLKRGREGRKRLRLTSDTEAWRRWEVSVVTPPRPSAPARLPKPLADRLKRAVLETTDADRELLEALAELAIGQPAETPEVHREIKFLTLSARARAEATSQQRQPELVDRLIKDSICQTRYRAEESRVLFELTVPNELKSGLAQVDNLVLVVDAESAAYPWELMSAGDDPLCIAKGLVRQLQTTNYRRQIGTRAGTSAYVVGDPKVSLPFRQLKGAEEEAGVVYDLLRTKFDVDPPLSKPSALEVFAGLYKRPYRIVHLAGHGHYQAPETADVGSNRGRARSGMVLDNGVFLTAVEVKQMQQVPELVFLNCCHIGQTGTDVAPQTPAVEFNRLAASVSRELIEMGVRAVVAAGWAVDDAAAKVFAITFYERMMRGDSFGRALETARKDTFAQFPDTNTWGAYQAYGDPDYRLDPSAPDPAGREGDQVDVAEFIDAVCNVGGAAEDGRASSASIDRLDKLVKACPAAWLAQTEVKVTVGYAYGKLGQFERAMDYLEGALTGEGDDSTMTLRAVEQLANFEARLADQEDGEQAGRSAALRSSAIQRLEQLLAVSPTAERHNLLGSAYKRRAVADTTMRATKAALTKARDHYRLAHQLNLHRQVLDPYSTLNWLTLAMLLGGLPADADELINRCEGAARERFLTDRSFFAAVVCADAALLRALMTDGLGRNDDAGDSELRRLKADYRDAVVQAAPTVGELDSVVTQIRLIEALLTKLRQNQRATKSTVGRLAELRRSITGDAP